MHVKREAKYKYKYMKMSNKAAMVTHVLAPFNFFLNQD